VRGGEAPVQAQVDLQVAQIERRLREVRAAQLQARVLYGDAGLRCAGLDL